MNSRSVDHRIASLSTISVVTIMLLAGCGGSGGGSDAGGGSGDASWHPLGEGVSGGEVATAVSYKGDLYVGGSFMSAGEVDATSVAIWRDEAWHVGGEHFRQPVNAMLVYDGKLYTGGNTADDDARYGLVVLEGDVWTRLGNSLQDGYINAMIPFDGSLIVAGGFIRIGGGISASIARWDGESYHEMGDPAPSNAVYALTVWRGDLYAAGWFQFYDSFGEDAQPINGIARWDGTSWHPVGGGLDESAYALCVYDDMLCVAGDFTMAGDVAANRVAAWDGTTWRALGEGADGLVDSMTAFDAGGGPALVIGGRFSMVDGKDLAYIAAWNGATWSGLGEGLNDEVASLTTISEGPGAPALIAGGDFYASGEMNLGRVAIWRK